LKPSENGYKGEEVVLKDICEYQYDFICGGKQIRTCHLKTVLSLNELYNSVRRVFCPRLRVKALISSWPLEAALNLIKRIGFSHEYG